MNNSAPGNKTSGLKTARHLPPGLGVGKVPGGAGGALGADSPGLEPGDARHPRARRRWPSLLCRLTRARRSPGISFSPTGNNAPSSLPLPFCKTGERDAPRSARGSLHSRAAPAALGSSAAALCRCPRGWAGTGQATGTAWPPPAPPKPIPKGLGCTRSPSRPLPPPSRDPRGSPPVTPGRGCRGPPSPALSPP